MLINSLAMEKAFQDIAGSVKNSAGMTVDSAMEWLRQAKVFEKSKLTQEQAQDILQKAGDNIDYTKFEAALKEMADKSGQTLESMQKMLTDANKSFVSSITDALSNAVQGLGKSAEKK